MSATLVAASDPSERGPTPPRCSVDWPAVAGGRITITTVIIMPLIMNHNRVSIPRPDHLRVAAFPHAPEAADDLALVQQRQVQRDLRDTHTYTHTHTRDRSVLPGVCV